MNNIKQDNVGDSEAEQHHHMECEDVHHHKSIRLITSRKNKKAATLQIAKNMNIDSSKIDSGQGVTLP